MACMGDELPPIPNLVTRWRWTVPLCERATSIHWLECVCGPAGSMHEVEMIVEKTEVMRIHGNQCQYRLLLVTHNWRMRHISTTWIASEQMMEDRDVKLKSRIAMTKQHSRMLLFTSKLHLNVMKKPVKCNIWSIAFGWCLKLDPSEIRTEIRYLESLEMWRWGRSVGGVVWKMKT